QRNPQAADLLLKGIRKQEAHELRDVMQKAEQEYQAALDNTKKGKPDAAAGLHSESIGLLEEAIRRFGPNPLFFYDLSLNYYALYLSLHYDTLGYLKNAP